MTHDALGRSGLGFPRQVRVQRGRLFRAREISPQFDQLARVARRLFGLALGYEELNFNMP